MFCATSQVSATLIGHSSSSGASIQSRISPKSERCSLRFGMGIQDSARAGRRAGLRTADPEAAGGAAQAAIFSRQ